MSLKRRWSAQCDYPTCDKVWVLENPKNGTRQTDKWKVGKRLNGCFTCERRNLLSRTFVPYWT